MGNMRIGIGEWWASGAAVAFAAGNVLTRVGAVEGDPLAGTVIRVIPLAAFGLVMMALRQESVVQLLPRRAEFVGWRILGLIVIYGIVIAPLAHVWLFLAFRYGVILVAVPLFSTFPLLGALLAVPFLGERFNRRIAAGIIFTSIGITVLTYGQHVGEPVSAQWQLGALYGLLTGLVWAISSNVGSYLLRRGTSIFTLIGITISMSALVLTLILAVDTRLAAFGSFSASAYWLLLLSGLFLGVAQYCLFKAFQLTSIASASTVKVLDIVVASAVAVLWLGETMNVPIAVGILLIVGGIVVVQLVKAANPQPAPQRND
jgi:drug/metabolite transporter (DMT)-like permease